MFLARQRSAAAPAAEPLTGPVTLTGPELGVWLAGERRGVRLVAPGGYHWAPNLGDEVLVLKTDGEAPSALGVPVPDRGLAPGEVMISTGSASIRLSPDGSIALSGAVTVNGTAVGAAPAEEES